MAESKKFSENIRIGIIGAGPGGLSAAECLQELGYKNVTVLEKTDHPGGMSRSMTYSTKDGRDIIYELGSFQPTASSKLCQLMKKVNLHVGKKNTGKNARTDSIRIKIYSLKEKRALVDFEKYLSGYPLGMMLALLPQGLRFAYHLLKNYNLLRPGYNQVTSKQLETLSQSYEKWLDEMDFKDLDVTLRMIGSIATFSNPEPRDLVPLIANIKVFLNLLMPPTRYLNGRLKFVKEGYQELWLRIAKYHNVIYNANIKKIVRKENEVDVVLPDKTLTFDKIIITSSPTETLKFLDATSDEKNLFSKVYYSPGWRAAFLAENLPHDALYALTEPYLDRNAKPSLQTFYPEGQVDDKTWLYTCVINSNKGDSIEPLQKDAEKMLHDHFGGNIIQWLHSCYWPEYVPCFSPEDVKNNIYQKLEDLQGQKNTYYLGGTLSGSSQAVVIDYSYDRLKKFFS